MHDVGKIGISDQILRKKGRLDPVEMAIMRTHTSIGAQVLHGSGHALMTMAEEIALTHHEKWDGSGYPNGSRGDETPLAGRIVAVCDVFDALTSVRAYKQAWSQAERRAFRAANPQLEAVIRARVEKRRAALKPPAIDPAIEGNSEQPR